MKNARVLGQSLYLWSEYILRQLRASALCLPDGTAFHFQLEDPHPTDPAFLPFAAEMVSRYFRAQPGDIFVMNDPYGGGSDLSQLTLVTTLNEDGLLAVRRVALLPQLSMAGNIHEEGLRIPPTPLLSHGQLNREILNVMGGHPLAPRGFSKVLEDLIQDTHARYLEVSQSARFRSDLFKTDLIREILGALLGQFRERLCDIASAETTEEVLLADQSRIRLRTVVRKGEILFDFSGTTVSNSWALTDRGTAGSCLSALLAAIDWRGPVHSRLFDCIKIQTPAHSCVSAKVPQSLSVGYRDGAFLILNLVFKTLQEIDATLTHPQTHPVHCGYSLRFENGREYADIVRPGLPASTPHFGFDTNPRIFPKNESRSLEVCEREFPLRFSLVGFRKSSGGHGELEGGMGRTKMIEILEPATLSWRFLPFDRRTEGTRGGKAGAAPEISLLRAGHTDLVHLGFSGTESLVPGDKVLIHSAGGGGYGEPVTETD